VGVHAYADRGGTGLMGKHCAAACTRFLEDSLGDLEERRSEHRHAVRRFDTRPDGSGESGGDGELRGRREGRAEGAEGREETRRNEGTETNGGGSLVRLGNDKVAFGDPA
jgi:hypothetical protein